MTTTVNRIDTIYRSRYSSDHRYAIEELEEGSYNHIIETIAGNLAANQLEIIPDDQADSDSIAAMCDMDRITESEVAHGVDSSLKSEIERLFFSKISRPAALQILNSMALVPLAALEISHGMRYTTMMVKDAWNKANPDEQPININPDYLP